MSSAFPLVAGGNGPVPPPPAAPVAPPAPPVAQQQQYREMAEPLHIQRLNAALDMRPFMAYARSVLARPLSSAGEESTTETEDFGEHVDAEQETEERAAGVVRKSKRRPRLLGTKEERQSVKQHIYNFSELTNDREWLYKVLLSDSDSDTEISDEDDYVKGLLKTHMRQQKGRENFYKKATNTQYAYYSAGLLSHQDMFPEHQQSIVGVRKRKRRTKKEKPLKLPKTPKATRLPKVRKPRKTAALLNRPDDPEPGEIDPEDLKHYAYGDTSAINDDDDDDDDDLDGTASYDHSSLRDEKEMSTGQGGAVGTRGRRRRSANKPRTPAAMAMRRRRVWQQMAKKELGRCHRAKVNNHKEALQNCKRIATMCMKVVRQRAIHSQKVMKETVWRAKRLTREMLAYWKRYERVERDTRRRMEREAEEQRKIDVEIIEAKRQQRKLNFLITQTELYAHFMSKKLGQGTEADQLRILSQLDEEVHPRLAAYDDYDPERMKAAAQANAEHAFTSDKAKTRAFDVAAHLKMGKLHVAEQDAGLPDAEDDEEEAEKAARSAKASPVKTERWEEETSMSLAVPTQAKADLPQPKIFKGTLKTYQIKGMTWLANLYDQGISGILADEMGLGKTVQSIAFLCHIAERYGVWGPFLVISPASTLHNWQQEMQRFVPDFNVVPYWGSPNERKILRQFWDQKDLHTRDASFHVVITSYQLIVSDYKYFNRIKWQYMVLDEAQAIKSSSSMRWKLLLDFNCRNRLLLSGTPIQNSMAELWALLHFIMPTLFDSHDEFNEWFSKDIESHAENKTGIDERQISRLHMILKPFMLRRIKKDVENELSDKIEIMVYCPLTIRQRLLYMALKQKIRIEDLLHASGGGGGGSTNEGHHVDRNFTSNLMNLVMQFRKVCNHPELFERRDAKSPLSVRAVEYALPRLVFDDALLQRAMPSQRHLLYNKFSIFYAAHVHRTLFSEPPAPVRAKRSSEFYARYVDLNAHDAGCFSFSRLCDLSPRDVEDLTVGGLIAYFNHYLATPARLLLLAHRVRWWGAHKRSRSSQLLEPLLAQSLMCSAFHKSGTLLRNLLFTGMTAQEGSVYAFGDYSTHSMPETIEHRLIRSKMLKTHAHQTALIEELDAVKAEIKIESGDIDIDSPPSSSTATSPTKHNDEPTLLPRFPHVPRPAQHYHCEPLDMPRFLYGLSQRVQATGRRTYCNSRAAEWTHIRHEQCESAAGLALVTSGLEVCRPRYGWSSIVIPDKQTLVTDAGKLAVLDSLLKRLKAQGHRVLIYSQMTKMIDLLEEYMWHRKHRYMRLDGSSKISARRDMVADFQTRADIFVFLLSTRAGGLGINLTAADTVIFYDSDWNPTVDQQAMDRAHRLGQTKQVTVYRLICKGTIEERILQRAREKSEIQRMVISGGNFKPDTLKPKEVVSLLLDDEEIELKYRQKIEPGAEISSPLAKESSINDKRRRNQSKATTTTPNAAPGGITIPSTTPTPSGGEGASPASKRYKAETASQLDDDSTTYTDMAAESSTSSPAASSTAAASACEPYVPGATTVHQNDESDNEALIVDCESPLLGTESPTLFGDYGGITPIRRRHAPRGTKRGRPRGSTRRGGGNGSMMRTPGTPTDDAQQRDETQSPAFEVGSFIATSVTPTLPPMKRGPGRPRLKTAGPPNRGVRGAPRARKPMRPLVVPLGHSPAATPLNCSPVMSPAPSPAHSERSTYSGTSGTTVTTSASTPTPTAIAPVASQ